MTNIKQLNKFCKDNNKAISVKNGKLNGLVSIRCDVCGKLCKSTDIKCTSCEGDLQ